MDLDDLKQLCAESAILLRVLQKKHPKRVDDALIAHLESLEKNQVGLESLHADLPPQK